MFAFLVMLLFSFLCFNPKIIWEGGVHFQKVAELRKDPRGRFLFEKLKNIWQKCFSIFTFNFAKTYLNGYIPMKLLLAKKVIYQCQNKSKDFLSKTTFLGSLPKEVNNKKLDQIISKLFTVSTCFTCIFITTFCFDLCNIFEHVLWYFVIDTNYKLLLTFQQV